MTFITVRAHVSLSGCALLPWLLVVWLLCACDAEDGEMEMDGGFGVVAEWGCVGVEARMIYVIL